MIQEEIEDVKETWGRPEVVAAGLADMSCKDLQQKLKDMGPGGSYGEAGVPDTAPIWQTVRDAMEAQKCPDQAPEGAPAEMPPPPPMSEKKKRNY